VLSGCKLAVCHKVPPVTPHMAADGIAPLGSSIFLAMIGPTQVKHAHHVGVRIIAGRVSMHNI
jgi:hypothetical protein